jgi:hypothetical protein
MEEQAQVKVQNNSITMDLRFMSERSQLARSLRHLVGYTVHLDDLLARFGSKGGWLLRQINRGQKKFNICGIEIIQIYPKAYQIISKRDITQPQPILIKDPKADQWGPLDIKRSLDQEADIIFDSIKGKEYETRMDLARDFITAAWDVQKAKSYPMTVILQYSGFSNLEQLAGMILSLERVIVDRPNLDLSNITREDVLFLVNAFHNLVPSYFDFVLNQPTSRPELRALEEPRGPGRRFGRDLKEDQDD